MENAVFKITWLKTLVFNIQGLKCDLKNLNDENSYSYLEKNKSVNMCSCAWLNLLNFVKDPLLITCFRWIASMRHSPSVTHF